MRTKGITFCASYFYGQKIFKSCQAVLGASETLVIQIGLSFRFSLYVSAAVAKHFAWLATLNIAQAAATAGAWLIPEDDLVGWFRLAHVRTMFYAIPGV